MKAPLIGKMLGRLQFDARVSPAYGHLLIREVESLTYRQLCCLALFNFSIRDSHNLPEKPLEGVTDPLDPRIGLLQEILDLSRRTMIQQRAEDHPGTDLLTYVPAPRRAPSVIVATAASPSLANFVEATFRKVAAAEDRPLAVDDVKPLPPDNASGAPNYFFIVICTLGGFLTVAALGVVAPTLPEHHRLAIAAIASLIAPILAYLIGGVGYGTFSGSLGTIVAMLALGAMYTFAVAVISRLLQLGLGALGTLSGSLVLIFLNFPSSGGSVATQLLPGFWRFLSHFWIGAAALDANRSALYFGGSGVATDVLKMLAWVAACAALLAVPIYLRGKRAAHANAPATDRVSPRPV